MKYKTFLATSLVMLSVGSVATASEFVALVNKNFKITNEAWGDWVNVGSPYNCTEWLPLAEDEPIGSEFTQTQTCDQDQERTKGTEKEERTIQEDSTQQEIGTKISEEKVLASDGSATSFYGASTAVTSSDLLVGAYGKNGYNGGVYFYEWSGSDWTPNGTITAPGLESLGQVVRMVGNTAVMSARGEASMGMNTGAAYVYTKSDGSWTQEAKIQAPVGDKSENHYFAETLDFDGNTLAIQAKYDSEAGAERAGAIYVYTRTGSVWSLEDKLMPNDPVSNGFFGWSIAVSGDTLIASQKNTKSFYVFKRTTGTWSQVAKVTNASATNNFGTSLALENGVLVVGDISGDGSIGKAYVYSGSDSTWTLEQELRVNDSNAGYPGFGQSVDIHNGVIAVGAPSQSDMSGGFMRFGSVHIYKGEVGSMTKAVEFKPSDYNDGVQKKLGWSVSLSNGFVAGGAYTDTVNGANSGSVYTFEY